MLLAKTARTVTPFAVLGLAQALIFFRNPRHFFIADTLNWMAARYRSPGEFFAGFTQADPAFWFRPLSQRTVESILFPLVRFDPLPYRLAGFLLFFSCTIALYLLAKELTESRRIAWFSVLIFTPHLIHAFVTYDISFAPELMFTLFFAVAAFSYARYLRTGKRGALIASALLFAASVLSKEAAVGLPFLLLAIWVLLPRQAKGSLRSLIPYFAILGVYLALVIGRVHVRHVDLNQLLHGTAFSADEYRLSLGRHMLTNLNTALTWTIGIPKGIYGHWELGSERKLLFLEILGPLVCIGAICMIFTSRRWVLLLGTAWFLVVLGPALPLEVHFLPYYLFAPLMGFAIAAGAMLDWAYSQCSRISSAAAITATVLLLGAWSRVHTDAGVRLAAQSVLLGEAARISGIAYEDVLRAYPRLPAGARLVLFNEGIRAAAFDTGKELFQLAYDNPTLNVQYSSVGSFFDENPDVENIIAFRWVGGHFVDVTDFIRRHPKLEARELPLLLK